jgi:hypothetical protein
LARAEIFGNCITAEDLDGRTPQAVFHDLRFHPGLATYQSPIAIIDNSKAPADPSQAIPPAYHIPDLSPDALRGQSMGRFSAYV